MSQNELTANELISMGVNLTAISKPQQYRIDEYHSQARSLADRLTLAGFRHSTNAMATMLSLVEYLNEDVYDGPTKFVGFYDRLATSANTINSVIQGEAATKTLILTDAKPPDAISQLSNLQAHQQALLSDMVTSLKANLARPAIVMAWALGYDIVRWWVHSEPTRLDAFNAQYKPAKIIGYADLFSVGERTFLDTCKNTQNALVGFNENTHHALVHLLNERNRFAHANYSEATINRANAFIEKMVETVTGPPFR